MAYKKKHTVMNWVRMLLLIFSVFSSSFLPTFAPRAEAFLGIGDFGVTVDVAYFAKRILDAAAQVKAQNLVDSMIKSTISWANNGFDGNPAYVTDTKGYFNGVASGIIGDTIAKDPHLGFLCSPFQAKIKQALVLSYTKASINTNFQCTLGQIGTNFDTYTNHFSEGGWDSFYALTQNDANNPYGAYQVAKNYVDQKAGSAVVEKQQQLATNSGFKNVEECADRNPISETDVNFDDRYAPGECIRNVTKTPGNVIKSQLDKILPSGLDKLVSITQIDQLVGAFAAGLLQRYVFSSKGLFSSSYADHLDVSNDPGSIKPPTFGWIFCANEGGKCDFDGEEKVRYGGSNIFKEITATDGVTCSSDMFGNVIIPPVLGNQQKRCEYYGQISGTFSRYENSSNWSFCASEGGTCRVSGTKQVRYGANNSYNIAVANNSISCNKTAFGGDPAIGEVKVCEYRGIGPSGITENTPTGPVVSCSPDNLFARVDDSVTWKGLTSYPATTQYQWLGTDLYNPPPKSTDLKDEVITYHTTGLKTMTLGVLPLGSTTPIMLPCSASVNVTPKTGQN